MIEPHYAQLGRTVWVWALQVPRLIDVADDADRLGDTDLVIGYRALAEAVADRPAGSCAVQVRLSSTPSAPGGFGVRHLLLGRARSQDDARELCRLAVATLPPELTVEPITEHQPLLDVLNALPVESSQLVEIRRRVEDVSALPEAGLGRTPLQPAVLRWAPDSWGLRLAGSLLGRVGAATSVILHMEPARPTKDLLDHLDATIRDIASDLDVAGSPLRAQIAAEYRHRLRELTRAALQVRVIIASERPVSRALAATVGLALTAEGGFVLAEPQDEYQRFRWWDIVESLTARTEPGTPTDELSDLAGTAEAARIVRFPVPATGGSPGLHSTPLPALPRGAEPPPPDEPQIVLGDAIGGGQVALTLRELNQHLLVAGLPGFGKTITTQTVLVQLWKRHRVPFLVLDPAKSDYTALAGELGEDLVTIDLGPDEIAFNPFGVPAGCSPTSHAGRVLAGFDAAFQLSATWPAGHVLLARAIFRAYERDTVPTLESLRRHLAAVIEESGYSGHDGNNIRAALLGRMEFLTRGPLGVALSAPAGGCVDYAALMSRPTVVGFRNFSGAVERSLVFGLLLSGLISYRESNPVPGRLGHVTVLEEAHRLLTAGQNGAEAEGVRLFVEAIAELRGSGEGFVVVDQAPTLLHPGVLKLAGTYCSHRLVDRTERLTVGAGLLLNERQSEDLARLRAGQAVIHSAVRTSSVVADIRPAEQLLTARASAPSARSLPWTAPERSGDERAWLQTLVARAASPRQALVDAAVHLQQTVSSAADFQRELRIAAETIDTHVQHLRASGTR